MNCLLLLRAQPRCRACAAGCVTPVKQPVYRRLLPYVMRRVLLADCDQFFVAVARLIDPDGAGVAPLLIVGGSRESRGVVCSASYEVRQYGVRSGMPISQALRLCPEAMCVPVPRRACSEKSRAVAAVLKRFAPIVEPASVDELYLDLTHTERMYRDEPLAETAARIRETVGREAGISVSIGGGTSKLVAKLAVERAKPRPGTGANGVHIVAAGDEAAFLLRCALADIPGVGPRFQQRLAQLGWETVADVVALDLAALTRNLGERGGQWLYDRVRGIDLTPVRSRGQVKSISREETFARDLTDPAALQRELLRLVDRAAGDLRDAGLAARTITVKLRDADFVTRQASRTVREALTTDRAIAPIARVLFARLRAERRTAARLVGVSLSQFDGRGDQLDLLDAGFERLEVERDRRLARAVDAVRERYGHDAIAPAILAEPGKRQRS
jgi:DNA polymerase IV